MLVRRTLPPPESSLLVFALGPQTPTKSREYRDFRPRLVHAYPLAFGTVWECVGGMIGTKAEARDAAYSRRRFGPRCRVDMQTVTACICRCGIAARPSG